MAQTGEPSDAARSERLAWHVDELVAFRGRVWLHGWAAHRSRDIVAAAYRFGDGPERAVVPLTPPTGAGHGGAPAGAFGFAVDAAVDPGRHADEVVLTFALDDGSRVEVDAVGRPARDAQAHHAVERAFWRRLEALRPEAVLELGARTRSGQDRRGLAPASTRYVGLDVLAGDNVDVVGDAHELSGLFRPASFDAVLAVAVFEHLLMPWKAVVEINRVLRPGGLVWVSTHQTFPLHDIPWDFWRYGNDTWRALFNPATGFSILEVAMGDPAAIVPRIAHPQVRDIESGQAFLGSSVLAEKTADSALRWDVALSDVLDSHYPT